MEDLECPYCKHDQEACEIYETEVTHEVECDGCGKTFGVQVEYYPSYSEAIMPCANDEPHEFVNFCRHPMVINGKVEYSCKWCDTKEDRPASCSIGCTKDKRDCWLCDEAKHEETK